MRWHWCLVAAGYAALVAGLAAWWWPASLMIGGSLAIIAGIGVDICLGVSGSGTGEDHDRTSD